MSYYDELTMNFRTVHGCGARFLYPIPVREVFGNKGIWDGAVWLFKLTGHPKASFGYAWLHPNPAGDDLEVTTVLEISPVDSTHRAVRSVLGSATEKIR